MEIFAALPYRRLDWDPAGKEFCGILTKTGLAVQPSPGPVLKGFRMRQLLAFLFVCTMGVALAQDPPAGRPKPRLIRDDQTQLQPEEEVIVPNAAQAKEHIRVGDFYFKRKNYKAAADRYEDATKYGPTWSQGYEKLASALEQMEEYQKAIDVCLQFQEISAKAGAFKKFSTRIQKLQKKQEQKAAQDPDQG